MAYARYDRNCNWYIFWSFSTGPLPKAEELLQIWHCDHRATTPPFTYTEVSEMVRTSDFSSIPGYSETDRELITECLTEFIRDVDEEYGTT